MFATGFTAPAKCSVLGFSGSAQHHQWARPKCISVAVPCKQALRNNYNSCSHNVLISLKTNHLKCYMASNVSNSSNSIVVYGCIQDPLKMVPCRTEFCDPAVACVYHLFDSIDG